MTPPGPHLDQRLDAWLDGRLAPDERREVERHLADCAQCRGLRAALVATRAALRAGLPDEPPPAALATRIAAALDREDALHAERARPRPRPRRRFATLLPLAAGVALAAAAALLILRAPHGGGDPVAAAFEHYATLEGPEPPAALRVASAADLERRWRQGRLGFEARVLDLSAMGIFLVGGDAARLAGRPAARALYGGAGPLVVCWMFAAGEEDLPPPDEVRRDRGLDFRVYTRGGATVVVWLEGEVLCALVAAGDPERVVQLALAKARAPAAGRGVQG